MYEIKNMIKQVRRKAKDLFKELPDNITERINYAEQKREPLNLNTFPSFCLDKYDELDKAFDRLEQELDNHLQTNYTEKKRGLFNRK